MPPKPAPRKRTATRKATGEPTGQIMRAPSPAVNESYYNMLVSAPDARAIASLKRFRPTDEIGVTGLRQYGGFVVEEWLRQLSGPRAAWVWREMSDNDATIGSIIFAIEMLARGVEWSVEEGADAEAAEFVEECRQDMAMPWGDLISEILSFVVFGFSLHEEIFKRRSGQDVPEGTPTSRYDDGKIGWHKLPIRGQETIWRWLFDTTGEVQAAEQISWDGRPRVIPLAKSLLFRTRSNKGNPLGRPALRNCFTAWYAKKNIESIEQIGIERDLAGIPVLTPPDEVDMSSPENRELMKAAEALVQSIKRDDYSGVVLPTGGWKLELIASGGSRQIDTNEVIKRYDLRIATALLADMLLTGQDKVGSYAMVDVKADIFGAAVDTWLDGIAEVFNRYAIPRLLRLNGMDASEPPTLQHGTARRVDLDAVAQLLERLTLAGAEVFPDEDLKKQIYERAGLPVPDALDEDEPQGQTQQVEEAEDRQQGVPVRRRPRQPKPPAPEQVEPETVQKAQRPKATDALAAQHGKDARLATNAFTKEVDSILTDLGTEAARAYSELHSSYRVAKADPTDEQTAAAVMAKLNLAAFVRKLARTWHTHYLRVLRLVQKALGAHLEAQGRHPEARIDTGTKAQIASQGAMRVAELEVERQVRENIEAALKEAREAGVGWKQAAEKIKEHVSAGPFIHAGKEYRAELIARTETTQAQGAAALAAFKEHPEVVAVEILDGLKNDSDEACKARDGKRVSFEEAAQELASPVTHPACTITLLPVMASEVDGEPAPEPELVAA